MKTLYYKVEVTANKQIMKGTVKQLSKIFTVADENSGATEKDNESARNAAICMMENELGNEHGYKYNAEILEIIET